MNGFQTLLCVLALAFPFAQTDAFAGGSGVVTTERSQMPEGTGMQSNSMLFVSVVTDTSECKTARLLIESLRTFGGPYASSPFWLFHPETIPAAALPGDLDDVHCVPIQMEERLSRYPFAYKVRASAMAEQLAAGITRQLVWLDNNAVLLQPPTLFDLAPSLDLAIRPVHLRNIGSPTSEAIDPFWKKIYENAGLQSPVTESIESLVDSQTLRPYFNCCAYSIRPEKKILQAWWSLFESLVRDSSFQSGPCQDQLHRIFLHQAVFSALVTKQVEWNRIAIVPPNYWYPLHLHQRLMTAGRSLQARDVIGILTDAGLPDLESPFFKELSASQLEWLHEHVRSIGGE
jgi:hypothetical protein